LTVLVEDVDAQGKISLKPVGSEWEVPEGERSSGGGREPREPREPRSDSREPRGEPREPRNGADGGPRRHGRRFRDADKGSSG
jgi:hypothetical protein